MADCAAPYEVPHEQVTAIADCTKRIGDLGAEISQLILDLRKTGNSGLVFHDPVSGELVLTLANVNEVLMDMIQEAEENLTKIRFDRKTGRIDQPKRMTCIGQGVFPETSPWGACESKMLDHWADGAEEKKYKLNMKTAKNRRTFTVGPITDLCDAHHMPDFEEDRISAKIIVKLSELSSLKAKQNTYCTLNSRIDKFVDDMLERQAKQLEAEENAKKAGKPPPVPANTEDAKVHTVIVKLMSEPGSIADTLESLRDPVTRLHMIYRILASENAFTTPYKEYMSKEAIPRRLNKTETCSNLVRNPVPRVVGSIKDIQLTQIWDVVGDLRMHELKKKFHFTLKRKLDPRKTLLQNVDRFTHAYKMYAIENSIYPPTYNSIKLLDVNGQLIRSVTPDGPRSLNFAEYAAMTLRTMWNGTIMIVRANLNCNDGLYANTESAQMVLPGIYLYKLKLADAAAPKLKLPFENAFEYYRELTEERKDPNAEYVNESMVGLFTNYAIEASEVTVAEEELPMIEGPASKRSKNDTSEFAQDNSQSTDQAHYEDQDTDQA